MKISENVLAVLSECETDGNQLRIPDKLDRKMYVDVNKVLEAAGGKWNRSAKAHIFPTDAAERLDPIILTGEVTVAKQEFGAFYTPSDLAQRVVGLADIRPGMRVMEPSAGMGAIAVQAASVLHVRVTCVEVLQESFEYLRHLGLFYAVLRGDFLDLDPDPIFDRVVMNPPFAKQADIIHVTHALKFLKPGGILVSIMSAGPSFRMDKRESAIRGLASREPQVIHPRVFPLRCGRGRCRASLPGYVRNQR